MEVHRQYNLIRKKVNDNPPKKTVETKKAIETKRIVETKKTSKTSPKKVPKRNSIESPTKKSPDILQRTNQTEVSSTSQPRFSTQRISMDKSEAQGLRKTSIIFSLEGELAKLKIPIPLSKLMRKNTYRSHVIKALSIEP
jgi:hypothetical protein